MYTINWRFTHTAHIALCMNVYHCKTSVSFVGFVSDEKPVEDSLRLKKLDQYIINPISEQDHFYNEVLQEIFSMHHGYLPEKQFRYLYYQERKKRWAVKSLVDDNKHYLEFEYSDNAASSKRFMNESSSWCGVDQSIIDTKMSKVNSKIDLLTSSIDMERESYDKCFENNTIKKRMTKQAEWHQHAVTILEDIFTEVKDYKAKLLQAKDTLKIVFKGVHYARKKSDISRRRKVNKTHSKKRKLQRNLNGALSFLNKVTKSPNMSKQCFPHGIEHMKSSKIINMSDLIPNKELVVKIRTVFDETYIQLLREKCTFSKEVYNHIESLRSQKMLTTTRKKRSKPEASTSGDLTEETSDSDGSTSVDEGVDERVDEGVDEGVDDHTFDEDSDPFDFVEVIYH